MNILCIGSRIIGEEVIKEVISAFLSAEFIDEEKYQRRLKKVLSIEARGER